MGTFAFDAYGTLFDVSAAVIKIETEHLAERDALAVMWRAKQLEYTWTLTLMGRYENFWTITEKALQYSLSRFPMFDASMLEELMHAYKELDAFADVKPTLTDMLTVGHEIAVFTNATSELVLDAMRSAGIDELVDHVVSLDSIAKYKTTPDAYQFLATSLKKSAAEITLVSSNRWDVAGGSSFGLQTIWLNRAQMPDEYFEFAPQRTIHSLDELLH